MGAGNEAAGQHSGAQDGSGPGRPEAQFGLAESRALLAASRAVLEHQRFANAARAIFDAAKEVIGAQAGYVALLTPNGQENDVLFLDAGGSPCTVSPELPMPIRGLRAETYRTGQAVYDNDFATSRWTEFLPPGHVTMNSVLFAPLTLGQEVVGLLGLANKPGGFTDADAQLASRFGEFAAIALGNSRAMEALEGSERRFRAVTQTASDGIICAEGDGTIVLWNRAAERIFGYTAEQAIGRPLTSIMPLRYREAHSAALRRLAEGQAPKLLGKTLELVGLRSDGSEFPLELSLANWREKEGVFFTGIARDITDRKRAAEQIEGLARFPSENPNPVLRISADGAVLHHNKASETVLEAWGCAAGESLPPPWRQIVAESLESGVARQTELQCGAHTFSLTFAPVAEAGYVNAYGLDVTARKQAEQSVRKARDELGVRVRQRTAELVGAVDRLQQEARDRIRAERELEAERQRLYSVLNVLPGYVTLKGRDRSIQFANHRYQELFGPRGERRCYELQYGREAPCPRCPIVEVFTRVRPKEWEWSDPKGRSYHVWAYPFSDVDGTPLVLELGIDVTERKELERQVIESSETERRSIGRDLHDTLGQKLTGLAFLIKVLTRKLSDAFPEDAPVANQVVQLVNESIAHVRMLARGLDPVGLDEGGLADALRKLADSVADLFGLTCRFRCARPIELPGGAEATHLYHIVQEAVNNATKHAGATEITISLASDGDGIAVAVEDNGTGIPDPPPTDGMGMHVMRHRASVIGGSLSIEPRPGGGTVLRCLLPRRRGNQRGVLP